LIEPPCSVVDSLIWATVAETFSYSCSESLMVTPSGPQLKGVPTFGQIHVKKKTNEEMRPLTENEIHRNMVC
jgi:hypothetical protein